MLGTRITFVAPDQLQRTVFRSDGRGVIAMLRITRRRPMGEHTDDNVVQAVTVEPGHGGRIAAAFRDL